MLDLSLLLRLRVLSLQLLLLPLLPLLSRLLRLHLLHQHSNHSSRHNSSLLSSSNHSRNNSHKPLHLHHLQLVRHPRVKSRKMPNLTSNKNKLVLVQRPHRNPPTPRQTPLVKSRTSNLNSNSSRRHSNLSNNSLHNCPVNHQQGLPTQTLVFSRPFNPGCLSPEELVPGVVEVPSRTKVASNNKHKGRHKGKGNVALVSLVPVVDAVAEL